MKRIVTGTAVALFGLAPGFALADCSVDHSAMASAGQASKPAVVQASEKTGKAPVTVANKVATKQPKAVAGKNTTPPSKTETQTVVAKTN